MLDNKWVAVAIVSLLVGIAFFDICVLFEVQ